MLDQHSPKGGATEYHSTVREIIEDPKECSAAWFMFLAQTNLHEEGTTFVGSKLMPENFASLGCAQSHPFSRGSSHITSADINDDPAIDPRYFSHPADLELMARHGMSSNDFSGADGIRGC